MKSIRIALTQIKQGLAWLPNQLVALIIGSIVVIIALSLHKSARKLATVHTRRAASLCAVNIYANARIDPA